MMGFNDSVCAVENKGVTLRIPKMTMLVALDKQTRPTTQVERGVLFTQNCVINYLKQIFNSHSTWPCFLGSTYLKIISFTPLFSSGNGIYTKSHSHIWHLGAYSHSLPICYLGLPHSESDVFHGSWLPKGTARVTFKMRSWSSIKIQPQKLLPCPVGQNDLRLTQIHQEENWVISLTETS